MKWRSQWPRGLRLWSAAARLLGLWVRIPPGVWMFVYCRCRVVRYRSLRRADHSSGRVLCGASVCDLETSWMRRPWPTRDCYAMATKSIFDTSKCMAVFVWRDSPQWARASSFTRFLDHTRRTTVGRTPSGRVIISSPRPLPDNTQHSQQTNIHAPGGIRTHNLDRRAAAELRLRPRGHWDWRMAV